MGNIKIGNNSISKAYFDSTEIKKIYIGSTLIYNSFVYPTVYARLSLHSPIGCTTDKTFPYTFQETTTINVTPIAPNDGYWTAFNSFDVGTTNGGNDVLSKTEKHSATPSVMINNALQDCYCSFVYDGGAISTDFFSITKASSAVTTVSIPSLSLFGETRKYKGHVRIKGKILALAKGTVTRDLVLSDGTAFDETVSMGNFASVTSSRLTIYLAIPAVFVVGGLNSFELAASGRGTGQGGVVIQKVIIY